MSRSNENGLMWEPPVVARRRGLTSLRSRDLSREPLTEPGVSRSLSRWAKI
jgi:hypothetical protein